MEFEAAPDVGWVAALTGASPGRAARAVEEASADRDLFRRIDRMHREGGRPSYVEIDAPFELFAVARLLRPRHIVEVGVSSGVSSAYLLRACQRNARGTLHSIDLPKLDRPGPRALRPNTASWALPPGRSSGWAVPFALRERWDLRLGDKRSVIPLLAEELPRIDLVVYDVPHSDRDAAREFRALDRRFSSTGVAIADHGPGGGLCAGLAGWARRRRATPERCQELGLFGFGRSARRRTMGRDGFEPPISAL
jgi:hypothetical protein